MYLETGYSLVIVSESSRRNKETLMHLFIITYNELSALLAYDRGGVSASSRILANSG